jgi:hypothetical protein
LADCHRRTSQTACKSRSGQQRRMAPPFSLRFLRRRREVHGGLSCEIVSAFARIRSLTTGTFNRVVKDRIAFRLSGANSVQANPHKCESDCPRNLTTIQCGAKPCQSTHPTVFPRVFHIGKGGWDGRPGSETKSSWKSLDGRVSVEESSWKSLRGRAALQGRVSLPIDQGL